MLSMARSRWGFEVPMKLVAGILMFFLSWYNMLLEISFPVMTNVRACTRACRHWGRRPHRTGPTSPSATPRRPCRSEDCGDTSLLHNTDVTTSRLCLLTQQLLVVRPPHVDANYTTSAGLPVPGYHVLRLTSQCRVQSDSRDMNLLDTFTASLCFSLYLSLSLEVYF